MRTILRGASVVLALGLATSPSGYWPTYAEGQTGIRGFAPGRAATERALESKFVRVPSGESAEANLRWLTSEPHVAGTDASRRVAEYIRDQFRAYGLQADLVSYRVLIPYPEEIALERVLPEPKKLATPEESFPEDQDTSDHRVIPGYNSYSPSGEVTAPVVYANYGRPEDFRRLEELGISVEGKIALVRYGQNFRGVKVRLAEEHHAAGVLIYSDPADDGYVAGDPYPRGPWRPMSGIQRGSVVYTFFYPGDPLTPGVASTESARRLDPKEAVTLPHTPTLPISARDAAEILPYLGGPRVPRDWQGGLPLTYHVGAGPVTVHLKLAMRFEQRPIYDVVGRLTGETDEWVMVGNHHDAWTFGAADPNSGTAVMLETARSLGELARSGWKPRRTILLCAWDGEEFGLLGSTEWTEDHEKEIRQKAVAYLNLDTAVLGSTFGGSGTPSLRELVREVGREVTDPRSGRSVYEAWRERSGRRGSESTSPARGVEEPQLESLGSGSDYTPFFHHAGIPAVDLGFSGEYGVYHSLYDDFSWMKKFGDPGFLYHPTMARIAGILLLRLADADVPAFDFAEYGAEVAKYVDELEVAARSAVQGNGRSEVKAPVDLAAVREAEAAFRASARRVQDVLADFVASSPDTARAAQVSRALVLVEQELLAPQGLVGRPWYRHTIFAPGTYAGYAAVRLPGVREALDRKDWETARKEAATLAEALRRATARLDEAARLARARSQ